MIRGAALLGAGLLAAVATAGAAPTNHHGYGFGHSFDVALWGDLPYTPLQATDDVPALIDDINAHRVAFSIHDGDIKNGSTPCDDAAYERTVGYLNDLWAPAFYTPGDNEWTDCHRLSNGGWDPLERLAHDREVFFAQPKSFGAFRQRAYERQSAAYPENGRWWHRGVLFVTLHVVGSNDNRINDLAACDAATNSARTLAQCEAAQAEHVARSAATIEWLRDSFAVASERNAAGVMLVQQANPGFEVVDPAARLAGNLNGFDAFLAALRAEVEAFGEPVLFVHGDSHYYREDKPMRKADGSAVLNFTRVETFGELDPQWVRVTVDRHDEDVFSVDPEYVD